MTFLRHPAWKRNNGICPSWLSKAFQSGFPKQLEKNLILYRALILAQLKEEEWFTVLRPFKELHMHNILNSLVALVIINYFTSWALCTNVNWNALILSFHSQKIFGVNQSANFSVLYLVDWNLTSVSIIFSTVIFLRINMSLKSIA